MNFRILSNLKKLLEEHKPDLETEITLDDGSIFTTSTLFLRQFENDLIVIGVEISSSPSETALFPSFRIHHIILKSRNKKKMGFHFEPQDVFFLNRPRELPEKTPENKDK